MIFGLVSPVIQTPFGRYYAQSKYWPLLLGNEIEPCSLPHHENGRHWSVNNFWPSTMGNETMMHRLFYIYDVMTVYLGENSHELFVGSLYMEYVVFVREAVVGSSLAYLPSEAANSSLIDVCNHAPLGLPKL